MKKLLLSVMMCFLLVGCGNTLKCTLEEEGEGTATYKIKFKGDEVSKVTMQIKFDDKDEAKEACEFYEEFAKEEDDVKIKCSGSKLTMTTTDVDEYEDMTKEELKEELEEDGYKCK